jgi:hypothetical protein
MKKETKHKSLALPILAYDTLVEESGKHPYNLNMGQLAAIAILEKYQSQTQKEKSNGHTAPPPPTEPDPDPAKFTEHIVNRLGDAATALKMLPGYLPVNSSLYIEVQNRLKEML